MAGGHASIKLIGVETPSPPREAPFPRQSLALHKGGHLELSTGKHAHTFSAFDVSVKAASRFHCLDFPAMTYTTLDL